MNMRLPSMTRLREIILFVIVGISNTGVDFLVLNLLILLTHHDGEWWLLPFNGLAFLAAVINSYILNGRFTFRAHAVEGDRWRFLRFVAVNAVGLIVNTLIVSFLSSPLGAVLPRIVAINASKTLATAVSLCWNYFAIKRWIFRDKQPVVSSDEDANRIVPPGKLSSADPILERETTSAG